LEALLAMCVVRLACRASWSDVFYIAAAVYSAEHIASMMDNLVSLIWPDVLAFYITERMNALVAVNWLIFMVAVDYLVYRFMFRKKQIVDEHNLNFNVMLMLLIVSLLINLYMNLLYTHFVRSDSLWIDIFKSIFNMTCSTFLLFIQSGLLRESKMEKRLQMVSMLWEQGKEQYRISKENIEAINIKSHDLKHQLLALKDKTDPKEYERMIELVDSYGAEIQTNNEVLDVVFQEKNFQCRKLGIQFTCIIDGQALDFIDTTDLYVLFGNLIDNCIEAVSRLPETEVKNIQITVRRDKGFVIVTTENGYAGELQWADGRLSTSKDDRQNHGFGILSIEKIIHKYGGRYSIETEDHIFTMNIVFPVNIKPA
ncbi:MAG: sensor histidine kinase, partial [Oscillospiraceae bacterium]|nr:sensor histidine kinase [Oscillospiraceae bacterium]